MKRLLGVMVVISVISSGCIVRIYKKEVPRTDIDINGNQGYLVGGVDKVSEKPVKKTRQIIVTEIEVGSSPQISDVNEVGLDNIDNDISYKQTEENEAQAFVDLDTKPVEYSEDSNMFESNGGVQEEVEAVETLRPVYQEYTVKQGDTLQKISYKFYGKYSLWKKIYDANKDILKNPDNLSVGQVIKVPIQE